MEFDEQPSYFYAPIDKWLSCCPFTAKTPVQIWLGVPIPPPDTECCYSGLNKVGELQGKSLQGGLSRQIRLRYVFAEHTLTVAAQFSSR